MADTLLATRLKKGMIIKLDNELFRIHDLMHVTPGNLRGFVRVKMRNIRNGTLAECHLGTDQVERQLFMNAPEPENGRVQIPDRPGFGVELNREAMKDTLVAA
mgnify:CR=1 FL=1